MCKIDHRYKIRCNSLSEIGSCHAAAHHKVCLNSVSDCLVRKHSAHHSSEHDCLVSRLGIHSLFFVHNLFVELVYLRIILLEICEIIVKTAVSAESLKKLNRCAFFCLGAHHHIDIASGSGEVSRIRIR